MKDATMEWTSLNKNLSKERSLPASAFDGNINKKRQTSFFSKFFANFSLFVLYAHSVPLSKSYKKLIPKDKRVH
jgi:hypothetical protein